MPRTEYRYDDPDHPDRVTEAIGSPPFTAEDHALFEGLALYEADLCPWCGYPKSVAWHSEMDGSFEAESYKCYACSSTVKKADGEQQPKPVTHTLIRDTRDPDAVALPPFVLGKTTERVDD